MRFKPPGRFKTLGEFAAHLRAVAPDIECAEELRGADGPLGRGHAGPDRSFDTWTGKCVAGEDQRCRFGAIDVPSRMSAVRESPPAWMIWPSWTATTRSGSAGTISPQRVSISSW